MKIRILCVLLLLISKVYAQQLPGNPTNPGKTTDDETTHPEKCATQLIHNQLMLTDSVYKGNYLKAQQQLAEMQKKTAGMRADVLYTIPVVVHVMHVGSAVGTNENISDAQIFSAIDALNNDFKNTGGTGVDINVEFCLASKDVNGNSHTGINRVNASGTSDYATNGLTRSGTNNESTIKALSKWDNTKYYNIWIVSELDGNNAGAGTQGFAYFPGASSSVDGAVILYNAFGTTGNLKSYTDQNKTTSHEIGHALNLYHTFEGDGSGSTCPTGNQCGSGVGDCCADIPPHKRSSSDCNSAGTNSCDGNSSNSLFVHNYMDYSNEDCQNRFTGDQKTRMRVVVAPGGTRENLSTSANLAATGCDGSNKPSTRFSAGTTTPCVGIAVQFTDESLYLPTSWSWSFTGASPSSSNSQNPSVTYNSTGSYNVTLIATNANGSDTLTKTAYISPVNAAALPLSEGFEGATFPPAGWKRTDPVTGDDDSLWRRTTAVSGFGNSTACALLPNEAITSDPVLNYLVTPPLSFSGILKPQLSFSVAYQRYYSTPNDSLIVYYSTDCGQTFTRTSYAKGYSNLYTKPAGGAYATFTPTSSEWRTDKIDLTSLAGQSSVVLKLERGFNTNGASNNLYIDDVEVKETHCSVTAVAAPLSEDFEGGTFPPGGWSVESDDASTAFGVSGTKQLVSRSSSGNGSSTKSAHLECFNYSTQGKIDKLITKPVNLYSVKSAKLIFKRAYKNYPNAANYDELRIYVSTNCGDSYGSAVYTKTGTNLATNGSSSNEFLASVSADWKSDTIDLASYLNSYAIVKFEVTNQYGNNLYLDDVQFTVCDTITWKGLVNNDWNTAGNWDKGRVPTSCDDVIIPGTAEAPTQPTVASTVECYAIEVKSSSGANVAISGSGVLKVTKQ